MQDFQNSSGVRKGYKWFTTNTQLLVIADGGKIVKAGVKRPSDFNFDALWTFAMGEPKV